MAVRKEGRIGDVLLLLTRARDYPRQKCAREEHSPITAGNAGRTWHRVSLKRTAAETLRFTGLGSIVGYPIFDLRGFALPDGKRKTLGVVDYVRRLEEVLIRTCADFGIPTKRVTGLTGVWTEVETGDEAKIAAIGVHISHFVTSHGFAITINTDLSYFDLIVPCGITEKPVTSMAKQLRKDVDAADVYKSISRNFGTVFQSQMLWLESLDALLGPSVGVPLKTPDELRKIRGEDDASWA